MNDFNDRAITPEERAEIMKRKMEVKLKKVKASLFFDRTQEGTWNKR